jgi:hypothetical protein
MGLLGFARENEFDSLIWDAAGRAGLDPLILKATVAKESGFNPAALRPEPSIGDASRGLAQVLFKTAVWLGYRGDPEGLFDPATSLDYGAKYLAYQAGRYAGSPTFDGDLYAAYNAGSVRRTAGGQYMNQAVVDVFLRYLAAYRAQYATPAGGGVLPVADVLRQDTAPARDEGATFWGALAEWWIPSPAAPPDPGPAVAPGGFLGPWLDARDPAAGPAADSSAAWAPADSDALPVAGALAFSTDVGLLLAGGLVLAFAALRR